MAATVGDNIPNNDRATTLCWLPRKWYGPESPCSKTDETISGDSQDPWVQPGGDFSGAKWIVYGAVALVVFWLSVRALEAYAELNRT